MCLSGHLLYVFALVCFSMSLFQMPAGGLPTLKNPCLCERIEFFLLFVEGSNIYSVPAVYRYYAWCFILMIFGLTYSVILLPCHPANKNKQTENNNKINNNNNNNQNKVRGPNPILQIHIK